MINEKKWAVPSFEIKLWADKKKNACIIIPVINEGDRIVNLLTKMNNLKIWDMADIIIVDGGSTDGSLETNRLIHFGVTGLIIKTGSGKLSAQLRCGYAFVLDKGYKNIITIDGNDKDDPASIPDFLNALENGYDFVQASRFVKGGIAINTPKSRDLAIKFIHAPVLSIASGFHWTDTTQGFRAYSSKMLLDERIAPFRDVFKTYELLAYLSYIAPKLGYRCIELPSSRIYPQGEVPTKISSFKGNIDVLKILFKACLGHYNPSQK
ncbi:glycosyltransferase family 2 protein [Atlantibacter sp.]|uniref:glycosyltransferase family 2 protein n=1 Tax=Atlantibacter sp. TaxID=1903473 RepID=UPI0028A01C9D|nr:glycosyltransferase family 2 protein [Atlantibacter sp.]